MIPTDEEKQKLYRTSLLQIRELVEAESDPIAVMASVSGILKNNLYYASWVGFYRVDPYKPEELVIGPFQGTLGCLRLPFGKGVCGVCARRELPVIVANVHDFSGHIACDSRSKSEIVVPVFNKNGKLCAVLDLDSEEPAAFNEEDCEQLEQITALIKESL